MISQSFKTIEIGGVSKAELIEDLKEVDVHFNEYAETLLSSEYFKVGKDTAQVDLVKVSYDDLKLGKNATYNEIVASAKKNELSLCPMCVGAFLRLEYLEQPEGPYLTIASELPNGDDNYPNGFYLRNYEGKLWLRGYRADTDCSWPIESEFVFVRNMGEADE